LPKIGCMVSSPLSLWPRQPLLPSRGSGLSPTLQLFYASPIETVPPSRLSPGCFLRTAHPHFLRPTSRDQLTFGFCHEPFLHCFRTFLPPPPHSGALSPCTLVVLVTTSVFLHLRRLFSPPNPSCPHLGHLTYPCRLGCVSPDFFFRIRVRAPPRARQDKVPCTSQENNQVE